MIPKLALEVLRSPSCSGLPLQRRQIEADFSVIVAIIVVVVVVSYYNKKKAELAVDLADIGSYG